MTANWDDLETFCKAVTTITLQERMGRPIGEIIERIKTLESQGDGADNTEINNRIAELEEEIASLKQKLQNPPTLKKPEPQQPAVIKKQEQPPLPTPTKTFFDASDFE